MEGDDDEDAETTAEGEEAGMPEEASGATEDPSTPTPAIEVELENEEESDED
jgi:hypothetical protein